MMDRESLISEVEFTGTAGLSGPISTARYAWQSVHLPTTGFVAGDATFEVYNEADGAFVAVIDDTGAAVAAIAVTAGQVLPVPLAVNYSRAYRLNMSTTQTAGVTCKIVNKT